MIIIHRIEDWIFHLFPNTKKEDGLDETLIIEELTHYYSFGQNVPTVNIQDGFVIIETNDHKLGTEESIFRKKNGYKVPQIDGQEFSGYRLLAFYYVSWKLAMPEYLESLHLPFDEEYKLAIQMIT
jgi:hypothetical protein